MEGRSLLVSDVDHTVLGDDAATREFAAWMESMRQRVRLAYNSGRFVASVRQSCQETDLPGPDAIIGGVGTQIWLAADGAGLDGWPPHNDDWDAAQVREALANFNELELQPEHLQSQFKVSYYGHDLPQTQLAHIRQQLAAFGIRAKVIYSSQRDLDVLPASAGKGAATARLAEHWDYRPAQVIVAGDSGNDLAMFQQGFRGIVVANAHEELKALVGENIYHATKPYATGVLEGMRYWLGK